MTRTYDLPALPNGYDVVEKGRGAARRFVLTFPRGVLIDGARAFVLAEPFSEDAWTSAHVEALTFLANRFAPTKPGVYGLAGPC